MGSYVLLASLRLQGLLTSLARSIVVSLTVTVTAVCERRTGVDDQPRNFAFREEFRRLSDRHHRFVETGGTAE